MLAGFESAPARKRSGSFLKKRTKKLLLVQSRTRWRVRDSASKSFCFFFQKEGLTFSVPVV
jgi:hypothetical protein